MKILSKIDKSKNTKLHYIKAPQKEASFLRMLVISMLLFVVALKSNYNTIHNQDKTKDSFLIRKNIFLNQEMMFPLESRIEQQILSK